MTTKQRLTSRCVVEGLGASRSGLEIEKVRMTCLLTKSLEPF